MCVASLTLLLHHGFMATAPLYCFLEVRNTMFCNGVAYYVHCYAIQALGFPNV